MRIIKGCGRPLRRHAQAYVLRERGMSYPRIAIRLRFGDHTAVIYAVRRIEALMASPKPEKNFKTRDLVNAERARINL